MTAHDKEESPPSPRSRRPSSWPQTINKVILLSLTREVCIPMESVDKIRAFRRLITEVRRSYREHKARDWEKINTLRVLEYPTLSVMASRPNYKPDSTLYPFTAILSPAEGFFENISQAVVSAPNDTYLPIDGPSLPPSAFEAELMDMLLRNEGVHENDDNTETVHSIFNKR